MSEEWPTDEGRGGEPAAAGRWDANVVAGLRAVLLDRLNTHDLADRVRALDLDESAHPEVLALRAALEYMDPKSGRDSRDFDEVFAPMIERVDGTTWPPQLSTVPADWVHEWERAAEVFDDCDVLAARLHDLLWCRRVGGRPDLHARAAAKRYVGLHNAEAIFSTTRGDWLARALGIAVEIKDAALRDDAVEAIVGSARKALESEEWIPGVSVRMIETLSALPSSQRPSQLDQLIDDAMQRYAGDPFVLDGILRIRLQLAGGDPISRQQVARQLVSNWTAAAKAAGPGLIEVNHLERALEVARTEGLSTEADALRAELQRPRSDEELGMEETGTEVSIRREEFDKYLDWFLQDGDVATSLERFASHDVLPRVEKARDEALAVMQGAPLQHLITQTITNPEGLPVRHLVTHDQKVTGVIAQSQAMALSLWGIFAVDILRRLHSEKGLQAADVAGCFAGSVFTSQDAEAVGRAYIHHASGRHEEAVLLTIPRIEAMLRRAARSIGINIFAEPTLDGKHAGVYRGMGELLRRLKGRAPENHRRYFEALLTDHLALNLRNRYMHGLIEESSATDSALVLHAALVLGTWRVTPPDVPATT